VLYVWHHHQKRFEERHHELWALKNDPDSEHMYTAKIHMAEDCARIIRKIKANAKYDESPPCEGG
jgi:hypothetical protein